MRATAVACSNVALVKYWGKRDAELNLPAVGSLSITLAALTTTTTVRFGAAADTLELRDPSGPVPADADALARVSRPLDRVRALARVDAPASVTSANDFPTGAGLASSAS